MKTTQLQTVPVEMKKLFDSILDEPETYKEVTADADEKLKKYISVLKVRRNEIKEGTMRTILEQLGFEEVQKSKWRKKLRAKTK